MAAETEIKIKHWTAY